MSNALRLAFVWLLVLIAVPVGTGPFEPLASSDSCVSACPCDEDEGQSAIEASPCDDDCEEECDGCCHARTPVAVGGEPPHGSPAHAVVTRGVVALDAPGCTIARALFRPPRSLG